MADILFLIGLIVFLVVLYFIFSFVKSMVKTLVLGIVLLVVVALGAGIIAYSEMKDLQENISDSTKLVLIAGEEEIVLGAEVTTFNLDSVKLVDIGQWQEDFKEENYEEIRGEYYRLYVFRDGSLDADSSAGDVLDALKSRVEGEDLTALLKAYKAGDIQVYPESILFKVVKRFTPSEETVAEEEA